MNDKDKIRQHDELLADHEIMINELKTMNLRLTEIVMIDRKRLDILERPWWKRLLGMGSD